MIEFANEGDMLTVGKLLRNERERQELSLEDVSDRTKINIKYLQAIEEDRKDGFPGDLYCELFTKSYAEALGLEYAKIRAGTFTPPDKPKESEKKTRHASTKSGSKTKKLDAVDSVPAGQSGMVPNSSVVSDKAAEPESNESEGSGKHDVVKYLVIVGAVVFCLLIVVIYIFGISSEKMNTEDAATHEAGASGNMQPSQQVSDEQLGIDKVENPDLNAAGTSVIDSGADGPVKIYPDSLEVMFTSTQESWASVVADGDTVFASFFKAGDENLFRAERELDVTLGRWEFISGSVYGHPMKEIASFHKRGWSSVKLKITKDNWEAFIDSSKLDNAQD